MPLNLDLYRLQFLFPSWIRFCSPQVDKLWDPMKLEVANNETKTLANDHHSLVAAVFKDLSIAACTRHFFLRAIQSNVILMHPLRPKIYPTKSLGIPGMRFPNMVLARKSVRWLLGLPRKIIFLELRTTLTVRKFSYLENKQIAGLRLRKMALFLSPTDTLKSIDLIWSKRIFHWSSMDPPVCRFQWNT
jgi:hypothetical protein